MIHATAQQQLRQDAEADSIHPATVQGLSFRAGGRTLLHRIDLPLERTGTTVIMGPNGAGKSLLLRLLHGLLARVPARCAGTAAPRTARCVGVRRWCSRSRCCCVALR